MFSNSKNAEKSILSHSAGIVGDYLLTHSEKPLTSMQVNKLAYISHGWNLAIYDKPLVSESIEAWKYGPVIPSLYHRFKKYGAEVITAIGYCDTKLLSESIKDRKTFIESEFTTEEEKTMKTVIYRHRDHNGNQLSGITHKKGSPWHQCYVKDEMYVDIPNDLIKEYYKNLVG